MAKKSQTEGFGSISIFASSVTGSFRFHFFLARDRISSPREGERGREGGKPEGSDGIECRKVMQRGEREGEGEIEGREGRREREGGREGKR